MINNGFMYWIFFGLSKMVYGSIPALYDAFIFFAKYQFFDIDTDIKQIWGNLYVLLSVLVLFAIAIKLINAIVNPDVLTDNKKGVKKAYFSALIAVFLTVLTPYAFTLLVHLQDSIIDNKTIEKLFFSTTSAEQNGGKVVAWTAITSFINLNELTEATAGTNHAYNFDTSEVSSGGQIYVLEEDVDTGLNQIYNSQPWQYTDTVHQNPILMLLAGCLIAYEFILLVMDTALRSIKLGLLQMMTPIILGAYIFKSDILKKWALEYIKTFIQIFLLFISISLLTKVLAVLPNILVGGEFSTSDATNNWLLAGIINVLAIMAALRLVKQVVPLINKIFGTNMQGKGGIKGRLGEMAAVGGLAQKAWGAFTTKAGNVGLKAAGAAALLGSGPLGWGAAAGAGALHHQWNKGFGKSTAWKDSKVGKGLRVVGAGARGVGVGLTSKGGIINGVKEGVKSFNESPIGGIVANDRLLNDFEFAEKNSTIKNGIVSGVALAKTDEDRTKAARAAKADFAAKRDSNLARVGAANLKSKIDSYDVKSQSKFAADTVKSNYDGLLKKFDEAIANETDSNSRSILESTKARILSGKQSFSSLESDLNLVGNSTGNTSFNNLAGSVSFEANKLQETLKSKVTYTTRDTNGNEVQTTEELFKLFGNSDETQGVGIGNFSSQIFSSFNTAYENAKNDLKDTMDKAKMSDRQKAMVNKTVSDIDTINSTLAATQAKWNK